MIHCLTVKLQADSSMLYRSPGARMSDQQLADAIGEAVEDADVKKVLSLVKKATPFVINLPRKLSILLLTFSA